MNKREARTRRAKPTRMRIRRLDVVRLSVTRSPSHISAQLQTADGAKTILSASTKEKVLKDLKHAGNVAAAKEVGKLIAQRALEAGIKAVAFDRSGYLYHGRVKALADGAREVGLEF